MDMLVTALVTPFRDGAVALDLEMLKKLVRFQLGEGVDQVLLGGTTGESGALSDADRRDLLDAALEVATPDQVMSGLGTGRLDDIVARGRDALERGVRSLLLVDCPYSGASSAALRTSWHGPVAAALPESRLYPYAVPGRTGTEMLPDDLARLAEDHPNVVGVKDATGRLARMFRVRELCGEDFILLCGDDPQARDALVDPTIRAHGVCSVVANLVPAVMRRLVDHGRLGEAGPTRLIHESIEPLFDLMCLTATETLEVGGETLSVPQRVRNPVPLKAAFLELGFDLGGCRPPLAGLGPRGRTQVLNVLSRLKRRPGEDPLAPMLSLLTTADAAVVERELAGRAG
jgi:4-hydroxy-tetrahydrodipicolinate synthase